MLGPELRLDKQCAAQVRFLDSSPAKRQGSAERFPDARFQIVGRILNRYGFQLRGRTPGPRARAPSDGRKSPGPPPRRRLRPAGHGAAAPRHRGAGRYQHASAHRAGYRDAVSVARRGGQVGRRSGRRVYASRRFPRGWAEWSAWVNGARDPARRHRDRGHTRPPSQPSRAPSLPTCSRRQGRPAHVRGTAHPHRRPVDAPGRPPGPPGARTLARRRRVNQKGEGVETVNTPAAAGAAPWPCRNPSHLPG